MRWRRRARLRVRTEQAKRPAEEVEQAISSRRTQHTVGAVSFSSECRDSFASVRVARQVCANGAPFVCYVCYGGAAKDGECGPRLVESVDGTYRVRPTELCALAYDGFDVEAPWAALPTFACPDGIQLDLVEPSYALDLVQGDTAKAHVTALKRGRDDLMYLVTSVSPSVERLARPTALKRAIRLAEDAANSEDKRRLSFETPLSPAEHLIQLRKPQTHSDDAIIVGRRAYAAITLREDACADVLRFLEYVAAHDRKADVAFVSATAKPTPAVVHNDTAPANTSWPAHFDADRESSDYHGNVEECDDDVPVALRGPGAACQLSFQHASRLARMAHRARADARLWGWIAGEHSTIPAGKQRPSSVRQWSVVSLLSLLPPDVVCCAIDELLREKSIVVVAEQVACAGAVALGLVSLLEPLKWQGALIMTLPCAELDLLGAPCPFVAGCSAATAALANLTFGAIHPNDSPLRDVRALFVDCKHDARFVESITPPQPSLLAALKSSMADFEPVTDVVSLLEAVTDAQFRATQQVCTHIRAYITDLLGGLASENQGQDSWKRYGEENVSTGDFDFIPQWFLAPSLAKLQLQQDLAHTQMLASFVHGLRCAFIAPCLHQTSFALQGSYRKVDNCLILFATILCLNGSRSI